MTDNNGWTGEPGVPLSDEIRAEIKAAAKALCHYPSGPNAANSCCSGIGRCEMKAAIAEITRLRAQLVTARKDALEEAAQEMDCACPQRGAVLEKLAKDGPLSHYWPCEKGDECCALRGAAIRALKGEGND